VFNRALAEGISNIWIKAKISQVDRNYGYFSTGV
jgi:hypothetical protein